MSYVGIAYVVMAFVFMGTRARTHTHARTHGSGRWCYGAFCCRRCSSATGMAYTEVMACILVMAFSYGMVLSAVAVALQLQVHPCEHACRRLFDHVSYGIHIGYGMHIGYGI